MLTRRGVLVNTVPVPRKEGYVENIFGEGAKRSLTIDVEHRVMDRNGEVIGSKIEHRSYVHVRDATASGREMSMSRITRNTFVPPCWAWENGYWDGEASSSSMKDIAKLGCVVTDADADTDTETCRLPLSLELKLREEQKVVFDTVITSLRQKSGGGLISLPTGFGKTVLGLAVAQALKTRTLIVVHKDFLASQWEQRIRTFFGERYSVGRIKGKLAQGGCDFIIATVQTIANGNVPLSTFRGIGLVIFDEVHHMSANHFSRAVFNGACAKYRLGLSATMDRRDGTFRSIEWMIGRVVYDLKRSPGNVLVRVARFSPPSTGGGVVSTGSMPSLIKRLVECPERNEHICRIIRGIVVSSHTAHVDEFGTGSQAHTTTSSVEKRRHLVVLSDRRGHCESLVSMLNVNGTSDGEIRAGLYIGGMKQVDLDVTNFNCNVIVGTYGLLSEGFDNKDVDTVVLATPRGDVRQAIGRCTRDGGGGEGLTVL